MNIEELIATYERKVKNLENECRGNASIAKAVSVAKLTAARQTLKELNSLHLDLVSKSVEEAYKNGFNDGASAAADAIAANPERM